MKTISTLVAAWNHWDGVGPCAPDYPSDLELRAAVPVGVSLAFLEPGQRLADHLAGVEVLYGPLPEADLAMAGRLRWVQLNSTGADSMAYEAFARSGIALTTLGGAITSTVAEHALALLFALTRNLHLQRDAQRERRWNAACGVDLRGLTLGLLGFGRIGRAIAERARAFGLNILAVDAHPRDQPDGVELLAGLDYLPQLLERSNALICSLPKTPTTWRLIASEQLERMPRGSFIVNVGRGGVIEETALLAALRRGRLGGVALDVTEMEPLPPDSPLWGEPNLLLTPHSAGFSTNLREKKVRWFADNLARYLRGEPLHGQIDPRRGF